jgi:GNAT superfamily N-acetyltransferase
VPSRCCVNPRHRGRSRDQLLRGLEQVEAGSQPHSLMTTTMDLSFASAVEADAPAIAVLRTGVADRLTRDFGRGPWSSPVTERGVLQSLRGSRVIVARIGTDIVGTLRLATKRPWAIHPAYFTAVAKALYLTDMAVDTARQRTGIGRRLIAEAVAIGRAWPASAVRLDAYDADAGAADFYLKCGFREVARVVYRETPLVYFEWLL